MIFNDNEIKEGARDLLGREDIAQSLVELLNTGGVETPLTFGILGGWGTGKSSLMYLMQQKIQHIAPEARPAHLQDVFVWFDTWAYARQEQSLWRALLLAVVAQLKGRDGLGKPDATDAEVTDWDTELKVLETSLYRAQTLTSQGAMKVKWGNALPLAADLALRYATMGASDDKEGDGFFARVTKTLKGKDAKEAMTLIEREAEEQYVQEVKALDDFRKAFRALLEKAGIHENGRRLVVFVDDLDRCLPEDAVAAIEAIKLFLYEKGCVFVLGMDPAVVERGIGVRYKNIMPKTSEEHGALSFDPADYLDKVIQVPFRIPPLARDQVRHLLAQLQPHDTSGVIATASDLLLRTVPPNPRTLKRVLNVLILFNKLQPNLAGDTTRQLLLTKLVLMQVLFRGAYQLLYSGGADVLRQLEGRSVGSSLPDRVKNEEDLKQMMLHDSGPFFSDLSDDDILALINLVKTTATTSEPS